ncbi:MAG: PSD1 and planctomycete cytochrome C domain-containing protein [Pirellulaceae bacterium]
MLEPRSFFSSWDLPPPRFLLIDATQPARLKSRVGYRSLQYATCTSPMRSDFPLPIRSIRRYLVASLGLVILMAAFGLHQDATGQTPDVDPTTADPNSPSYSKQIQPLLRRRCFSCHGAVQQEGGLRLDSLPAVQSGGASGSVLPDQTGSRGSLMERVTSADPSLRMPPKGSPLTPQELQQLGAWIDAGAPADPVDMAQPPSVAAQPDQHWSFQTLKRPEVPQVDSTSWTTHPIDAFIAKPLEDRQWTPNPPADPPQLLRRLFLDLTGLPPSIPQQLRWEADPSEVAYERLVDELLASPAYAERQARRWLDVVRYADSNGYERDAAKPEVWRYRDAIVRAFLADVPFDQLIVHQVAGDELDQASPDAILATGFLRLGPWDDEPADPAADRMDQLDDIVSTISQSFLGLTLGCARCHDHKFDPLTQRDYYGMVAFVQPLVRPRDGRTEKTLPVASVAQRMTMPQEAKLAATQGYLLDEPPGPVAPTHVLLRGNPSHPGETVTPAPPEILLGSKFTLLDSDAYSSRRRLSLARWLIDPEHPLTARVLVNRVWQWHFGEALVRTPNDFGLTGQPPTHPQLLDFLAHWLIHEADWSIKKLSRLIVTSSTYRQSSAIRPLLQRVDPENRLVWRYPRRRLEVEPIRDSILSVSGQLDRSLFGPAIYPQVPREALESHADKASIWPPYDPATASRRTLYAFTKRSLILPMLEVFDLCDTTRSSGQRSTTTTPTQALSLYNGDLVMEQSRHWAERLCEEHASSEWERILAAWRTALCRAPSEAERSAMERFLKQQRHQWHQLHPNAPSIPETDRQADLFAWQQATRVLLNLNEFVYPD